VQPSEYQQHSLWEAVTGLGAALDSAPSPDGDDVHKIERIRAVHAELDQRRDLNPYLMDETLLDQAQTTAEAVRSATAAYANDPQANAAQLDTAVAQTAQVLTAVSYFDLKKSQAGGLTPRGTPAGSGRSFAAVSTTRPGPRS
jgi:hypothetical protein